jgi:hypothetical protein
VYEIPSSESLIIGCYSFYCIDIYYFVDPVSHAPLPHLQRADGLLNYITLNAVCMCVCLCL